MKLKSGTIYVFKTTWGEAHEGIFRISIRSANVFSPLPFVISKECPRLVNDEDIEWAEPICPMTNFLTEDAYNEALTDFNE